MGLLGFLLRIARAIVNGIISSIKKQVEVVAQGVEAPIRQMVSQVLGGAWKGDGAQRFVEEMNNDVLKQVTNLMGSCSNTGLFITKALDTMFRADKTAARIAGGLMDVFKGIFT